jgi:hypothetical protein
MTQAQKNEDWAMLAESLENAFVPSQTMAEGSALITKTTLTKTFFFQPSPFIRKKRAEGFPFRPFFLFNRCFFSLFRIRSSMN